MTGSIVHETNPSARSPVTIGFTHPTGIGRAARCGHRRDNSCKANAERVKNLLSFMTKKLDRLQSRRYRGLVPKQRQRQPRLSAAATVRDRVTRGKSRYWKHSDFADLPASAVAMTLSRLAKEGVLQRVGKGVYYRPLQTSLGPSIPAASGVASQTLRAPLHPAGLSAANALGLSTQNPGRPEYATPAPGPPTALRGAVVHTGRPAQRGALSAEDGAILETLRDRARYSDLSPQQTARRLLRLLADERRFMMLAGVATTEPPRVRAMLGAIGQELNMPARVLDRLKGSLNPLSRFDFGRLRSLRHAREWQAK